MKSKKRKVRNKNKNDCGEYDVHIGTGVSTVSKDRCGTDKITSEEGDRLRHREHSIKLR